MARIDWAVVCDSAFLDRQERLCVIGLVGKLMVPAMPFTVRQLMLVARLADIQPVDAIALVVTMVTPAGLHDPGTGSETVAIELVGEYVFASFRDVPLFEEGAYRFQIKLRGQAVVSVAIPVMAASSSEGFAVALH